MKKMLLLGLALLSLTGCENVKYAGGNEMVSGSRNYYYAYVRSQLSGDKYYHIQGWAEYGPDGAYMGEGGKLGNYVGLELQLAVSGDVIYYYEPGLMYVLSKQYNPAFGKAIE